jgi:hypothetical protein
MRKRLVPGLAVVYFVAMAVFLTYPGYVPFNRVRPFVLGMPFTLFWQVLWISGAVLVLAGVFLWERKRRSTTADGPTASPPDRGEAG